MVKEILVVYGVDIDVVVGWLGSYGGEDLFDDILRGFFVGEVGILWFLKLFKKYYFLVIWFLLGYFIEIFFE